MRAISKSLIMLLLLMTVYSCLDNRKFYKEIKLYYKENCSNLRAENCSINLKDIINTDWDSVYLIKGDLGSNYIKTFKNINLELLLDPGFDKIIFVKRNNVIYQEEVYPQGVDFFDFLNKSENTLIFDFDKELHLSSEQANFKVESEDGKLFRLNVIQ